MVLHLDPKKPSVGRPSADMWIHVPVRMSTHHSHLDGACLLHMYMCEYTLNKQPPGKMKKASPHCQMGKLRAEAWLRLLGS